MEILEKMLQSFSPTEEKHFQKYLLFRNPDKTGLENRLFSIISTINGDTRSATKEIIKRLYKAANEGEIEKNKDAYHKLRMRLTDKIEDFILVEKTGTNQPVIDVVKHLFVARFYFLKGQYQIGWKYAEKAEQMAFNAEQFDLL